MPHPRHTQPQARQGCLNADHLSLRKLLREDWIDGLSTPFSSSHVVWQQSLRKPSQSDAGKRVHAQVMGSDLLHNSGSPVQTAAPPVSLRELALEAEVQSLHTQLEEANQRFQQTVGDLRSQLSELEQQRQAAHEASSFSPPVAIPSEQTEWVKVVDTLLNLSSTELEGLSTKLENAARGQREMEVRALEAEAVAARLRVELQERDASTASAIFASSVAEQRAARAEKEQSVALVVLRRMLDDVDRTYGDQLHEAHAVIEDMRAREIDTSRAMTSSIDEYAKLQAAARVGERRCHRAEEDAAGLRVAYSLLVRELSRVESVVGALLVEQHEMQTRISHMDSRFHQREQQYRQREQQLELWMRESKFRPHRDSRIQANLSSQTCVQGMRGPLAHHDTFRSAPQQLPSAPQRPPSPRTFSTSEEPCLDPTYSGNAPSDCLGSYSELEMSFEGEKTSWERGATEMPCAWNDAMRSAREVDTINKVLPRPAHGLHGPMRDTADVPFDDTEGRCVSGRRDPDTRTSVRSPDTFDSNAACTPEESSSVTRAASCGEYLEWRRQVNHLLPSSLPTPLTSTPSSGAWGFRGLDDEQFRVESEFENGIASLQSDMDSLIKKMQSHSRSGSERSPSSLASSRPVSRTASRPTSRSHSFSSRRLPRD